MNLLVSFRPGTSISALTVVIATAGSMCSDMRGVVRNAMPVRCGVVESIRPMSK